MSEKPKRRRGAPYGNKNNLKHGLYAAEAVTRRKERFAALRRAVLLGRMSALLVRFHETGLAN